MLLLVCLVVLVAVPAAAGAGWKWSGDGFSLISTLQVHCVGISSNAQRHIVQGTQGTHNS